MKKVVLGHGTHTSLVVTLQLFSCVYVHTGLTARAVGEGTGLSPSAPSIPSFLSTMYLLDGHDILNQGIDLYKQYSQLGFLCSHSLRLKQRVVTEEFNES